MKNVEEILSGVTETLTPSRSSYNLQRGLTLFTKMLEKKYASFVILGCSPKKIKRRTQTWSGEDIIEEDSAFLSLGSYLSFVVDGVYYYYQFEQYNTLFPDLFGAVKIENGKIPPYYLRENANNDGHFYKNIDAYTNQTDSKYFNHIAAEFMRAFESQKQFTTRDIHGARWSNIEQTIYY